MEISKSEQFWLGVIFGIVMCSLIWLSLNRIMAPVSSADRAQPEEIISAYKIGKVDALRSNPFNYELEQKCMELWADSVKK